MEEEIGLIPTEELMELPPGFRFHPTPEEIIINYLTVKVMDNTFDPLAMGEVELNSCEPWDLPSKAKMGEKEYYFYCHRGRKYPTGMRTNRATKAGYWKATGKDKEIHKGKDCLVGMKKTLVFYRGRAPRGVKTNWVMHEFRLEGRSSYNLQRTTKDDWVVCKVFHKTMEVRSSEGYDHMGMGVEASPMGSYLSGDSLPPLVDPSYLSNTTKPSSSSIKGNINYGCDPHMGMSSNLGLDNQHHIQLNSSPSYSPFQPSSSRFIPTPGFSNSVQPSAPNGPLVCASPGPSNDPSTGISSDVLMAPEMTRNRSFDEVDYLLSSAGASAEDNWLSWKYD